MKALELPDGSRYEGKMRLAQLNVADTTLDFWHEQSDYFGRSSALVYIDGSDTDSSHIYLGGASDDVLRLSSADAKGWAPAVFHLKPDGTKQELFKIKLNNSLNTIASQIVQVDHMKKDSV